MNSQRETASGTKADSGKKVPSVKAWMPLWIGDYLADTGRLTTEQHGAFLLLLMDYWRSGPPQDDNTVLAQITKLPLSTWKKHRPVLKPFFRIADGLWHNKRLDQERAKAIENKAMVTERAKRAAAARWGSGDA